MAQGYIHNTACRVCSGTELVKVLDLGATPPANAYVSKERLKESEPTFPLVLYFCQTCSLVQLLDVVDPSILFKGYHFLTGASTPAVKHFEHYAQKTILPLLSSPDDLVIDIGGNDGIFLSYLKNHSRVLNVDPADNLKELSEKNGVPFYSAFFTSAVADELLAQYGTAKVVTANNVFAHTDPIRDVFEGVAKLIGDDGVFIFEVHWVKHLVGKNAFDQIYHEHLCFYSLHALKWLVEAAGMTIFDVAVVPMQGQSLRVFVSKNRTPSPRVSELLSIEQEAGLTDEITFHAFATRVAANRDSLRNLLFDLKRQGKRIVGYGAPAKSNTLLHYLNIGADVIEYVVDSTPLKQGLYTPGTRIPIFSPERIRQDTPDYVVIFAWNFAEAIMKNEHELLKKGVHFVIPIPEPHIVPPL